MCFQDDAFSLDCALWSAPPNTVSSIFRSFAEMKSNLFHKLILKDNFYYIVAITREAVPVVRALAAFVVLCLLVE
jgi:hypothetical protein